MYLRLKNISSLYPQSPNKYLEYNERLNKYLLTNLIPG